MVGQSSYSQISSAYSHLPPLESGDRLTRPEFERRYAAVPHIKKAELVEGIVYVASPLRFTPHSDLARHLRCFYTGYSIRN
jgi:hypothetical protein